MLGWAGLGCLEAQTRAWETRFYTWEPESFRSHEPEGAFVLVE